MTTNKIIAIAATPCGNQGKGDPIVLVLTESGSLFRVQGHIFDLIVKGDLPNESFQVGESGEFEGH